MSDHQHGFFDLFSTDVKFTITDGQVTGLERVFGTKTLSATLPAGATFTVGTGTVTETLSHGSATETLTYTADTSDGTLYHLTQEATTFDTTAAGERTYAFTIAGGAVTAVSETHGHSGITVSVDTADLPGTAFSVSGNTVTETTIHGNTLETLKFTSTDGMAYHLASVTDTFIAQGSATTALDVHARDRLAFTFSGSAVTLAQAVKPDGTKVDLATHGNTTVAYTQPAAGYVVETATHGSHTSFEVYHDGNGDGVYTEVAHGSGSTVDIVGLQAQITSAVNALL